MADMEDSTHETDSADQETDMDETDSTASQETRYHLAILSHESVTIPFEETIVGLLTQFCRTRCASLHTSILVEGMPATLADTTETTPKRPATAGKRPRTPPQAPQPQPLVLVDYKNYRKELVPTTAHFQGQSADVLIALCHGFGPGDGGTLAGLIFQCTYRNPTDSTDIAVFARPPQQMQNPVTLHKVLGGCKLALLLCCRGTDILNQYKTSSTGIIPDLLYCDTTTIDTWSVEIYMVLLINILESDAHDLDHFYEDTKGAIRRIMQIVKLFDDDHVGFWGYLQHVGCVTDVADEKDRQELEFPPDLIMDHNPPPTFFRVFGRVCAYNMNHFPRNLLEDFRTITLVEKRGARRTTFREVPDITFTRTPFDKKDRYLRRYQQLTRYRTPPETPVSRTPSAASSLGPYPSLPTPETPRVWSDDPYPSLPTPPTPPAYTAWPGDLDLEPHAKMTQALAQLYLLQ